MLAMGRGVVPAVSINRLISVDLIEKIILKEVIYLSTEGEEPSRKASADTLR